MSDGSDEKYRCEIESRRLGQREVTFPQFRDTWLSPRHPRFELGWGVVAEGGVPT